MFTSDWDFRDTKNKRMNTHKKTIVNIVSWLSITFISWNGNRLIKSFKIKFMTKRTVFKMTPLLLLIAICNFKMAASILSYCLTYARRTEGGIIDNKKVTSPNYFYDFFVWVSETYHIKANKIIHSVLTRRNWTIDWN